MTERPKSTPRVRRTSKTLADGRELIYFDDSEPYLSDARSREAVDERPLDVRPTAGPMRLDPLTGEWISIADRHPGPHVPAPGGRVPLCPTGHGTMASEIPAHEYDVVVFEISCAELDFAVEAASTHGALGARRRI
jgi:UDPglucose--hexose-1-phosphate uridylyltransferase